jgi:hypothetical protein
MLLICETFTVIYVEVNWKITSHQYLGIKNVMLHINVHMLLPELIIIEETHYRWVLIYIGIQDTQTSPTIFSAAINVLFYNKKIHSGSTVIIIL